MNYGYGGYGNGGYGSYGGMGMMNGNFGGAMNNPNQQDAQMGMGIKVMYGVLSGGQSLLHLVGSFIDIAFFVRQIKGALTKLLIFLIKQAFRLLKYIITLRWIYDSVRLSGSVVNTYIIKAKYLSLSVNLIKILSIISKYILNSIVTISVLLLKFWKTSQLKGDETDIEENDDKDNTSNQDSNIKNGEKYNIEEYRLKYSNSMKISEERWSQLHDTK